MKRIFQRLTRLPVWAWLAALWAISTAARFGLALLMTQNPIIMPDESLYINLSRSVLEGWVALRGQPLTYDSLLYPLLLAPLRALSGTVDFYRGAQLLNAAVISLSAFPAYWLARDITGNRNKALGVAALTLTLADFAISQILMAESLCYPLALTALYGIYRALGEKRTAGGATLAALVSGLCYMAKPGYAALGAVLCAALLMHAVRGDPGGWVRVLAAGTVFVGMIALNRLIGLKLGIDYAWKSIYQNQTPALTWGTAAQALQGALLYLYFLPMAVLVFPAVVPLSGAQSLNRAERSLTGALFTTAILMILGTCYAVSISEYSGAPFAARVHLRYFTFLAPAFLALSLSPRLSGLRLNRQGAAMLALLLASSVAFTPKALLSGKNYTVDALSIAAVTGAWPLTDPKTLFQLLFIALTLFGGYTLFTAGWTEKAQRRMMGLLAVFLLVNNFAGYDLMRHNEDPQWSADAQEAAGWMDGQPSLFVAGDGQFFWNPATALEARTRDQLRTVELDDLIGNTGAGGVFQPFIPRGYWTTNAVRTIGAPKYLVLDSSLLYAVALRQGVTSFTTTNRNYTFVEVPEDGAWVHSALSGLSSGWVVEGSRLTVFDPALCREKKLNVQVQANAGAAGGALILTCNGQTARLPLETTEGWVQYAFDIPGDGQSVTVALSGEGSVHVSTYLVG